MTAAPRAPWTTKTGRQAEPDPVTPETRATIRARAHGRCELPARLAGRTHDDEHGCWIWTGTILNTGYGQVWWQGRPWFTHRLTYTLLVAPIGPSLTIDHLCRVRACCNPAHLEPVSRGENTLRGETTSAANLAKSACPAGHPYDHVDRRGWRKCRTCNNKRRRDKRAALRDVS